MYHINIVSFIIFYNYINIDTIKYFGNKTRVQKIFWFSVSHRAVGRGTSDRK